MKYRISRNQKTINGNVVLPASKSISNRVLLINALSYSPYPVQNLSGSDDTQVLKQALLSNDHKFDIGHAGTSMRFLTAFLSRIAGEWELTGSERMKQRPIGILVDALNELGACIEYTEKKGFPPLKIFGTYLKGKELELDGSISSQYISALLMIAPCIENGLTINLKGDITSRTYIELTLKLMEQSGIRYIWERNRITIAQQDYIAREFTVESDWSAASYWYQILAMANGGNLFLENLYLNSLQGDSVIVKWFERFGIYSEQKGNGVFLVKKENIIPQKLTLDFIENPDVAQTMACLCVAKRIPFHFSGLKTLKIKETDRIAALQNELAWFGASLKEPEHGELSWDGTFTPIPEETIPLIKTYHDHRMALSFAPMALLVNTLDIENPMVVTKSYPGFWNDLLEMGFNIAETD